MASNDKQLYVLVDGQTMDIAGAEEAPVSITYELEDGQDFEQKRSATALNITLPATLNNQKVVNSFHNPNAEDLSTAGVYRNPRPCAVIAANTEVLAGKAMLQEASHTDRPESYTLDCVGGNGDWMIDLQETSLFNCLPTGTHHFDNITMQASWFANGVTGTEYVYAPARYRRMFSAGSADDTDISVMDMRPALFIFPMIRRAFASVGYAIQSDFFDTNYFRRMVLPWTWGDFLKINSSLADLMLFRSAGPVPLWSSGPTFFTSLSPSSSGSGTGVFYPGSTGSFFDNFELSNVLPSFGLDNNANYSWNNGTGEAKWTYKSINGVNFGTITARFGVSTCGGVSASMGSNGGIYIDVYRNGSLAFSQLHYTASAGAFSPGVSDSGDNRVYNFSVSGLNPGDTVSIKFRYTYFKSALGTVTLILTASEITSPSPATYRKTTFELFGISIDPGGIVDFTQYDAFKNYKFLDLMRGLVDSFDLILQTDSVNKVVRIEPAYPYDLKDGAGVRSGYFSTNRLDWTGKQDQSQESVLSLYTDSERILSFKHKPDSGNGGLNIHNKRYGVDAGASKYLLSQRFKKGKRELVNRFFAAPMHYNAEQFKTITGITPQLMVFIPENVANTSADESEEVFEPVLAFYKGLADRNVIGGWRFEGNTSIDLPWMFAVNYKPGGEFDPVLTYSDQAIDDGSGVGYLLGIGLMKRFFLSRLAVIEYGKLYNTWMKLNNNDVTNWFHREAIVINGADYYLIKIDNYRPLVPLPAKCTLWKYIRPTQANSDACFPSLLSVTINPATLSADDIRYAMLTIFNSDLP